VHMAAGSAKGGGSIIHMGAAPGDGEGYVAAFDAKAEIQA
jgi:hypothetical protein